MIDPKKLTHKVREDKRSYDLALGTLIVGTVYKTAAGFSFEPNAEGQEKQLQKGTAKTMAALKEGLGSDWSKSKRNSRNMPEAPF